MTIYWSNQAVAAFWEIRDNIYNRFGIEAENDYVSAVDEALQNAINFPKTGVEELELSPDGTVRSVLINRLSRIIYYIEEDILYVADVWDVRQDPHTLHSHFGK